LVEQQQVAPPVRLPYRKARADPQGLTQAARARAKTPEF
jgi:hypothetical protein